MKALKLIFCLMILSSSALAQNIFEKYNIPKEEAKKVESAVDLYYQWDNDEQPIEAVRLLREIGVKNDKNWLAPFWASYISSQLANVNNNAYNYLEDAQNLLVDAEQAYLKNKGDSDEAYLHGLKSLIHTLTSFYFGGIKDQKASKSHLDLAIGALNDAVKKDFNNPVVMVFAATQMGRDAGQQLYSVTGAIALLEKAKSDLAKRQRNGSADPAFMNQHWIESWLKNLRPPNQ